jgi:hypothetical protein
MVKYYFIIKVRALFITIVISLALLILSEITKDWFSGGSGACSWKASALGIYSSSCISHKVSSKAECTFSSDLCNCCSTFDIDTVHNLSKFGNTFAFLILQNFVFIVECIIIVWLNYRNDRNCNIWCKSKCFTYFLFLVDKIFITVAWVLFIQALYSNKDVKFHTGIIINIIALVFTTIMQLFIVFIKELIKRIRFLKDCCLENRSTFCRDLFRCCFNKRPKETGAQDGEASEFDREDGLGANFERNNR